MLKDEKSAVTSVLSSEELRQLQSHFGQASERVEESEISKRLRFSRSLYNCYLLTKYAGFDVKALHDPAMTFYLNTAALAVAVPLFRRFRVTLTGALCYACVGVARFYWGEKLIVRKGVIRHALFGDDDLAHELRLLLLFHNSQSAYREVFLRAVNLRNSGLSL